MENRVLRIDLFKLVAYIFKRAWVVLLCGIIGFVGMYFYSEHYSIDTYSASGTMYVLNGNPNLVNYQYTNTSDLDSAVQLLDTYKVVVKSNKVMDAVAERLSADYPGITPQFIAGTLSMSSVSKTGVVEVVSRTWDAKLSKDICNAVLDVAPEEIIRVVNAGAIEIIDYAEEPLQPDQRSPVRRALIGALAGIFLAVGLLALLFLTNHKVRDEDELTTNYTPPVLASIQRNKKKREDPKTFVLTDASPMEVREGYAKLRMNLVYTMAGKERKTMVITSAVSGEGKSTIASNLAISCAKGGKKVLLIDGDLRRARQSEIFGFRKKRTGLSDILIGKCSWNEAVIPGDEKKPSIIFAGRTPPNPAELLGSGAMSALISELEKEYDLVLLDAPPINIVSDPLVISEIVAGCVFVVRQNYSDHREVRKALVAAEMMGMDVMGFVFYGEELKQRSYYYSRKYYKDYYKYDTRGRTDAKE